MTTFPPPCPLCDGTARIDVFCEAHQKMEKWFCLLCGGSGRVPKLFGHINSMEDAEALAQYSQAFPNN